MRAGDMVRPAMGEGRTLRIAGKVCARKKEMTELLDTGEETVGGWDYSH